MMTGKMIRPVSVIMTAALLILGKGADVYAWDIPAQTPRTQKTYSVGDVSGGFTVTDTYDFEAFDAKVYVFEHEQTGGKAVFIQNDDPNKYFMLEFDTKAENNKGTAHVLEHSIMSGSGKYPSRSLANSLRNRAYLTYMNAFTKNASTSFPVASLSEKQLLKMADYYTDLCFDPMILRNKDIFRSEAWRLTFDETSGKPGVAGTIYSEMSGRYSPDMEAMAKAFGMLYEGCASSYIAGGIPQDILSLSYEEVRDFYRRNYTSSNCTAYLYGDIKDAGSFLDILDIRFYEASSAEDDTKREVTGTPPQDDKTTGYTEMNFDFPAAASADTAYASEMVYAIDLGKLPDDRLIELYAFARFCGRDHSSILLQLASMFPGSSFSFSIIPDGGNIIFAVSAGGMGEDEASALRSGISALFADMAQNGLHENELGYFRTRMETDTALSREGSQAPADLLMSVVNYASNGRGLLTYMKLRDSMSDMNWFDNDLVRSIASYLAMPEQSAIAVVTPRPGLLEENMTKLDEALEKLTSSMSEEEKKKIADDGKRVADAASDDPTKYLDELRVIGISDLSQDVKKYEICDTTDENGLRRVGVYTSTPKVQVTKLCIDASVIPQDMLGYLSLYVDLVNGRFVPTEKYRQEELADMISGCNIRGQDIGLTVSSLGNDYTPYVAVQFMCSPEMTAGSYDLAYERLFDSIFDDPVKIREGITSIRQVVGENIAANPEQIARYIAYSADAGGAAYHENTHYLEYYEFLKKTEKDFGGNYRDVCEKLKEVGRLLCQADGCIIGYALMREDEGEYLKAADGFADKLTGFGRKNKYTFEKYAGPAAIMTGSPVVSNVRAVGDITKFGVREDDATLALALSLVNDRYVRGQTRDLYGAYTCSYMEEFPVVSVYTARDPMIKETYDAFSGISEAYRSLRQNISQKELDEYITRMYSQEMLPSGDISDATKVLSDIIAGRGTDRRARRCAQQKAATVQALSKFDALFEALSHSGNSVTIGSAAKIDADKECFAKVVDPFAN